MNFFSGYSDEAFLLLHGGAGPMDPSADGIVSATRALAVIAQDTLQRAQGLSPVALCADALAGLEDDAGFNAGYGSALQRDGVPRLSASLMDGESLRFSGVISLPGIRYPSKLALHLQDQDSAVLTAPGHELLAKELGLSTEDLITEARRQRWEKARDSAREKGYDTVGAVSYAPGLGLASGTSTGGKGFEVPGRVSDSATVAGNYASRFAAISLTGIGEEIVNAGVAVRIETRVRDGMSLEAACRKTFDEAVALGHEYGWIACDGEGRWCIAHTSEHMTYYGLTWSGRVLVSS